MALSGSATKQFDITADKLWPVMADWECKWLEPEMGKIGGTEGTGVGATRTVLFTPPDSIEYTWTEKVTAVDNEKMTWSYIITSPLPPAFPINIDTMVCTMSIKAGAEGKCEATVGAMYDSDKPDEMPPIGSMYEGWLDAMFTKATGAAPPTKPEDVKPEAKP